ncbi:sensor histidine kinase [Tenuibacillus multivorans]|uniref:histidine kinase n=1 Tax=Tenuibacillus multivorans TaxID=237069 RepID=A0A1H0DVF2_9BACI|nr:sensor histidine kinase [Tenuibacillus multivorans]GEL76770.1 sensor histidine kinase DesK [Tenuibacillus multivorans]SDN73961.1 two-component system, NarL family, sensor histidine kinase DesK [Tenuibacillus multivorans]
MQNWYNIFPKNLSINIYVWIIFSFLPFFFIFRSTSWLEVILGFILIVVFFVAYRLSFLSNGWFLYACVSLMMLISIGMSLFYGYVYFALFLAFFIGNIKHKGGFITLYVVHIVTTMVAAGFSVMTQEELFRYQLPFIVIAILGVIILPINTYNRLKRQKLEAQLVDANEKISQLMVYEERQRIARDLHDTLGQKLSLIGLKSDLARRLIERDPGTAQNEITDINQTARTALKEVRDMLSDMRGAKLDDEIEHVTQLLKAADIEVEFSGVKELKKSPALVEDVVSMCLKELVTNVVKHSQANKCQIKIRETDDELSLLVKDNGVGLSHGGQVKGHGLRGIQERLEFVNGEVQFDHQNGTKIEILIPNVSRRVKREEAR